MSQSRPTFSGLRGGLRIGEDFFRRIGVARSDLVAPRGLVDRVEQLARPGVDVTRIDPAVMPFGASLRLRDSS